MEVVGGAHGVDDDVGEGAGVEAFDLDVVAERRQVTVQRSELAARPVVVGVLRRLNRHLCRRRRRRRRSVRRRRSARLRVLWLLVLFLTFHCQSLTLSLSLSL